MNEHRETPSPSFSEQMDSNLIVFSTLTDLASHSDLDVLATSFPHAASPSLTSSESTVVTPPHVTSYSLFDSTVLLYEDDTTDRILSMATTDNRERSIPFLQRVQLVGPEGYVVRATGQVDDGAMRNCISKKRWERYGHCLSPLRPSRTRIKVANGTKITPLGQWHGTVRVGNIGAPSSFEVFDCGDAFDVILGKPWLKSVKAVHDYGTDEITIHHNGQSEVIPNSALHPISDNIQILSDPEDDSEPGNNDKPTMPERETPSPSLPPTSEPEPIPAKETIRHEGPPKIESVPTREPTFVEQTTPSAESSPWEQLDKEWARIHQIRASARPWRETRYAQYLDTEPLEDDDEDEVENTSTEDNPPLSTKERRRRDAETLRQKRDEEGEVLLVYAITEADEIREQERLSRPKRKRKKRPRKSQPASANPELDQIYLLEESETRIRRLKSKLEYLRVINEPDPLDVPQAPYSIDPYQPCDRTNDLDDGEIHKLGDVRHAPFKINRGTNTSRRVTNAFDEDRVNEIVSKVEFGDDLTPEQLEEVKQLVRDFADIFALSMSEVLYVD